MHVSDNFKNEGLTKLIKQERKKLCPSKTKSSLNSMFSELYAPSLDSFLLVLDITFFLFMIVQFLGPPTITHEDNHYQNLIAIQTGIGTIIFALVIFIAESMRDDETKDKARVLLKESFLFPLAVAQILVFLIFLWGDVNYFIIVLVVAMGLLTIWSLYRIVAVLLSRQRFAQQRAELLKERLKQCIDLAIDERIGNNLLLSRLNEKDIKLVYYPSSIDNQSDYYCFNTDKFGIVTNINLGCLKEFADIVDSEGRNIGFSFGENKIPKGEASEESIVKESGSKILKKNNRRYLVKKFNDVVNEEYRILVLVDKSLLGKDPPLKKLEALVKKAFVIRSIDNFAKEVRYEISGVKDQFITAIENNQLGTIVELRELYIKLADGFLEHITDFVGGYSLKQAQKECLSLFSEWEQVTWLSSDIRILLEKSMQRHDIEVIRHVSYLPIAISIRAIDKNDQYLFQEFIWFPKLLYMYASKEIDNQIKVFLTDRSWRYLKELSDFYVERKLRKDFLEMQEIERLKDFGIYIFTIYQGLLKAAFDNRDIVGFDSFMKATKKLFENYKPSSSGMNADELEWLIENKKVADDQITEFEDRLRKQKILESVKKEITLRKNQMFFGLASWILDECNRKKADNIIKEIYQKTQKVFPSKIEEFTYIFMETRKFEVVDFWGWGWWEERIEGEPQWYNDFGKLDIFYAVKSLSLIADKNDEEINKIELPHNRALAYLVEGNQGLIRILDDIKKDPNDWKLALSDEAIGKIDSFKSLLSKVKLAQENEELLTKKERSIDKKKVIEFKEDVRRGFFDLIILREIFENYRLFENHMDKPILDKKPRFGINIVEDKAIFFENWHIHFDDWGRNYGHDLASFEDSYLFNEIIKNCQEISKDEFENTLTKFKSQDDIIIIATHDAIWRFLMNLPNFKPKWHREIQKHEIKGFEGIYEFGNHSILVFEIYPNDPKGRILILNKSKLGQLLQFSPLSEGEDPNLIIDIFYMNIQSFSENVKLMEQFINEPPEWLRKVGGAQKQREHLRERVLIHVFERIEYRKPEEFEGYQLILNREVTNSNKDS